MIRAVSTITSLFYRYAAKPLLFKQQPDKVHQNMLKSGRQLQKSTIACRTISSVWAYDRPAILGQKINGIYFKNPVGLSAGFDKNFELVPLIKAVGFGFMEGGSMTLLPCAGNPKPWFRRLPKTQSILVHVGLANHGVAAIIRRIKQYPERVFDDFPLNISVAKTNSPSACSEFAAIDDYIGSLRVIQNSGLGRMITLNISCPNTYGGEPFNMPGKLGRLLDRVDVLNLKQPVFIKMPIDLPWPEFHSLLKIIVKHKVAGVTIGNLAKDRSKVELKDPLPANAPGGLSGKPTWELSNDLIRQTYKQYGDRLTIIGVGGIFSAEDAYTKIRLGASLVELITGMIYQGPQVVGQINYGLMQLLRQDGFSNISEVIGRDV